MSAMEKMIASMLGITPEGLSEMVTGFQQMIINVNNRLLEIQNTQERIEEKQIAILSAIGVTSNDDCNHSDRSEPSSGSD